MEEPSVLDYIKSRLRPKKYPRVELPEVIEPGSAPHFQAKPAEQTEVNHPPEPAARVRPPWLFSLALLLALAGQFALRPRPERSWAAGAALLVAAAGVSVLALIAREWQPEDPPQDEPDYDPPTIYPFALLMSLTLALLAFFMFRVAQERFSAFNLIPLAGSLGLGAYAFWVVPPGAEPWKQRVERWSRWRAPRRLSLNVEWPGGVLRWLAGAAAIALILFFRFYRLGDVPPEMNSDHAEKILDIIRVLNGEWLIFFPSNGGREALIFYLGAALHRYFGLPLGFMLLKIGSSLIGLAALPFLYGLGVELGGKRVGWLALTLAGIAYWPNVVSRFGLRLPFYFLFTAALLFYLVRGLRRGRRNDFIWAGVALGLGLYGYTPDRLLPLTALLAVGLFLLHHRSRKSWVFGLTGVLAAVIISIILFVPLFSYILAEPSAFLARALTRVSGAEQPLTAPAGLIFIRNVGRALAMFSWDNGEIWPVSIPGRPALNIVAGALFYIGAATLAARYALKRNWLDLFLLLSIPLLQLPSTLALAFPAENPNLYRAGGAMIPVFLMAGVALDGVIRAFESATVSPGGRRAGWAIAICLIVLCALQDYSLVFDTFYEQYRMAAWNSSEMGALAREFEDTLGKPIGGVMDGTLSEDKQPLLEASREQSSPETVWVIGYPYWVDTRLVALNAGEPGRDFELTIEEIENTLSEPRAKLFIVNKGDLEAVNALRRIYPQGWLALYPSKTPTKEFQVYFVPPVQ